MCDGTKAPGHIVGSRLVAGTGIGGDIAEGDGEAGSGSRCRIDSRHRAYSRSSSGIGK